MVIHHICIQTRHYEASKTFYTELLDFKVLQETSEFHTRDYNTWLTLGGFMIELQTAKKGQEFLPYNKESEGIPHFCLYSDRFDSDYSRIKASGQGVFRPKNGLDVYEVENGRLFKIVAPEGTIIEIRDQLEL